MVARLKDTLLIVGGKQERAALRSIFESGFDLLEAESCLQAAMLALQNGHCIAAVLADVPLGEGDDLAALAAACHGEGVRELPLVLFLAQHEDERVEERAFGIGVTDVVRKPFTALGLQRRLQVLLDVFLHRWQLEKAVEEQDEAIRRAKQTMMDALSAIIEHRSTESGKHVLRIRHFTRILLEDVAANYPEYGLDDNAITAIASAAALHDIGKISIPDEILNKPGKLTAEEFEVMKTHTTVGGELVQQLQGIGDEAYLRYAYNIALHHHERWDGSGYPAGLAGDDIPICAQVVGIADAYDALTTERAYKKAFSCATAANMILNGECGVFSPELYECFKHVRDQFAALAVKYADGYSPKNDSITAPLPTPVWGATALGTAELTQVKYQTLMHYTGDTVIEMNLSDKVYHVVYSPDSNIDPLVSNVSLSELLQRIFYGGTHSEDADAAAELHRCLTDELFNTALRRKSAVLRFYVAAEQAYLPYRVTLLRINTRHDSQKAALLVLHRLDEGETAHPTSHDSLGPVRESPALRGLVCAALRCRADEGMTLCGGGEDLFPLCGYTAKEIENNFGGHYIEMIHEDDRAAVAVAMDELAAELTRGELEYRLKGKDGSVRWVLDKCRGFVEQDGNVYVYHAVTDHSRAKEEQHRYEEDIERNRAIIEQSDGIVFEWDMASDTMYCSPKWEQRFGYAPVSKNYGAQMGIATHFHPDDLPIIREAIRQAKEEHAFIAMDVRIADRDAKYLWSHISGAVQLDESGELKRIIGLIQDVDTVKRAELALREKAERDALTRLFNKDTTRQLISEAVSDGSEELSALLVLDLDNFKLINDTYGHLYGDTVLTRVGHALKRLFREGDIIGRIGGDEFVVYMKNIPSEELVHTRCDKILQTVQEIMGELAPQLQVSCSIGASLYPHHGRSYNELFRHGDEALYYSKSRGKNTYGIYSAAMESAVGTSERATTDIDSDTQPHMTDGSFVQFVFHSLYESRDTLATVDKLLRYVGQSLNVDRAYIFENNHDNTVCSNTFEWCNEGITPEKDNLQDVSYVEDIAGWDSIFDEKGVFYCTDITALPAHFRTILEPQGIKSMLQCAIYDNGVFRGYVGFDDCTVNRLWTKDQIQLLSFLAEILAIFLLKQRAQDNLQDTVTRLLSVLNKQKDWIYVIDPKTHELRFLNDAAKQLSPEAEIGMLCYRMLHLREEPCENCPVQQLRHGQEGDAVIENKHLSICGRVHATRLDWKGEDVCLLTVQKIEQE